MKIRILLLILVLAALDISAQMPYYDALDISRKCTEITGNTFRFKNDSVSREFLASVLRNYLSKNYARSGVNQAQVFTKFSGNPFFGAQLDSLRFGGRGLIPAGFISSLASSVGGLDVTNIADGLAKFLVERTKQELSNYFFERFREDLDSIPQLRILFPFTFQALQAMDKEIYNYANYISLLRDCFQKDLAFILPHLQNLVDDDSMDFIFKKCPELRTILSDGLFIVSELQTGLHPGAVLHDYRFNKARETELSAIDPNLYPAFQTLDLVSQSLRARTSDRYWIRPDSLGLLYSDTIAFRIYLGLLYQQAGQFNITFSGGVTLTGVLVSTGAGYRKIREVYEPYLSGLAGKATQVDYYFRALLEKGKNGQDKPTYQDYYSLYNAALNFFEEVRKGIDLAGITIPPAAARDLSRFFVTARGLGNIYIDIYEKQYSSAITEVSVIFDTLFHSRIKAVNSGLDSQIESGSAALKNASGEKEKKELQAQIRAMQARKTQNERFDEVSRLVMKYGSLAAAVVKAGNSDEVQKAIEAVALPAGSSKIKRESQFNVSLNGFVGAFAGHEFIQGVTGTVVNNYGIAAPVGISVSWGGIHGCSKHGNSLGFFVSVIDLGALASFRFGDDSTSTVPTIQLKDIIAPGMFLSWGIAKTPFTLSAGAQIGPLLRSVAASVNTFSNNYYWRVGVTLTVDIPILNLYNIAKR